jgi:hypothetical protein
MEFGQAISDQEFTHQRARILRLPELPVPPRRRRNHGVVHPGPLYV